MTALPLQGWHSWRWSTSGQVLIGTSPEGKQMSLGEIRLGESRETEAWTVELLDPQGATLERKRRIVSQVRARMAMTAMVIAHGGVWSEPAPEDETRGQWLRRRLNEAGISQAELARRIADRAGRPRAGAEKAISLLINVMSTTSPTWWPHIEHELGPCPSQVGIDAPCTQDGPPTAAVLEPAPAPPPSPEGPRPVLPLEALRQADEALNAAAGAVGLAMARLYQIEALVGDLQAKLAQSSGPHPKRQEGPDAA